MNEAQLKAIIRQGFSLQNTADKAVLQVDQVLANAMSQVKRLVEALPEEGLLRGRAWEDLEPLVKQELNAYGQQLGSAIENALVDAEPGMEAAAIRQAQLGGADFGPETISLNPSGGRVQDTVARALNSQVNNVTVKRLFNLDGKTKASPVDQALFRTVDTTVRAGMINGTPTEEIARQMIGEVKRAGIPGVDISSGKVSKQIRSQATAMARTATQDMARQVKQEVYDANADAMEGMEYEWTTALDSRTCETCSPLDGRRWKDQRQVPSWPLHPNCRCQAVPVDPEDPFWNAPEKTAQVIRPFEKGAYKDGYKTPIKINGEKFYRKAVPVTSDTPPPRYSDVLAKWATSSETSLVEALGPTRARWFKKEYDRLNKDPQQILQAMLTGKPGAQKFIPIDKLLAKEVKPSVKKAASSTYEKAIAAKKAEQAKAIQLKRQKAEAKQREEAAKAKAKADAAAKAEAAAKLKAEQAAKAAAAKKAQQAAADAKAKAQAEAKAAAAAKAKAVAEAKAKADALAKAQAAKTKAAAAAKAKAERIKALAAEKKAKAVAAAKAKAAAEVKAKAKAAEAKAKAEAAAKAKKAEAAKAKAVAKPPTPKAVAKPAPPKQAEAKKPADNLVFDKKLNDPIKQAHQTTKVEDYLSPADVKKLKEIKEEYYIGNAKLFTTTGKEAQEAKKKVLALKKQKTELEKPWFDAVKAKAKALEKQQDKLTGNFLDVEENAHDAGISKLAKKVGQKKAKGPQVNVLSDKTKIASTKTDDSWIEHDPSKYKEYGYSTKAEMQTARQSVRRYTAEENVREIREGSYSTSQRLGGKLDSYGNSLSKKATVGGEEDAVVINDFLQRAPKYEGQRFRGTGFKDEQTFMNALDNYKDGKEVMALESWSDDAGTAEGFAARGGGKVQVMFHVAKNKKAVGISSLNSLGEQEILAPAGSRYRVKGFKKVEEFTGDDLSQAIKSMSKTKNKKDGRTLYEVELEEI